MGIKRIGGGAEQLGRGNRVLFENVFLLRTVRCSKDTAKKWYVEVGDLLCCRLCFIGLIGPPKIRVQQELRLHEIFQTTPRFIEHRKAKCLYLPRNGGVHSGSRTGSVGAPLLGNSTTKVVIGAPPGARDSLANEELGYLLFVALCSRCFSTPEYRSHFYFYYIAHTF